MHAGGHSSRWRQCGDMGARGYFKILKEFHKRRTSVRVSDAVAR